MNQYVKTVGLFSYSCRQPLVLLLLKSSSFSMIDQDMLQSLDDPVLLEQRRRDQDLFLRSSLLDEPTILPLVATTKELYH